MNYSIGNSGGVSVYARSLIEALADFGKNIELKIIITSGNETTWMYRKWPDHVKFIPLQPVEPNKTIPTRAYRRLKRIFGLPSQPGWGDPYISRQISSLGLDILHYPATIIFPITVNDPCVLTFFDLQQEYYPQFFTAKELEFRQMTYRASVEKARRIIAPSQYTRNTLMEMYSVPSEKISVIPVGTNPIFHPLDPSDIDTIRIKYKLPENYMFYPANPWPHKNHARLLAALRYYKKTYGAPPKLVLTGRLSNETRNVRELAIAAGVEDIVIDLGFVPIEDLPGLYNGAKLMIFPSLFEGFGIPLIEAMSCGCPIAAANVTSIPECVTDSALLFDPYDVAEIAYAIHSIYNDPILSNNLVQKGLHRVEQYKWENIVPDIVSVYNGNYS